MDKFPNRVTAKMRDNGDLELTGGRPHPSRRLRRRAGGCRDRRGCEAHRPRAVRLGGAEEAPHQGRADREDLARAARRSPAERAGECRLGWLIMALFSRRKKSADDAVTPASDAEETATGSDAVNADQGATEAEQPVEAPSIGISRCRRSVAVGAQAGPEVALPTSDAQTRGSSPRTRVRVQPASARAARSSRGTASFRSPRPCRPSRPRPSQG